jgi:hypothetical protein
VCISCFLLLGGSKLHDYRISLFLCSEVSHFVLESKKANKAFKSDSQRLALSLQASLVFMAQWFSLGVSVVHPLAGRYVVGEKL